MRVVINHWTGREARVMREAKRMTVREFARHLGVSERTISKWEAGLDKTNPRPEMQAMLDTALAMSTHSERVRFVLMLDPKAKVIAEVEPVDLNLRISADTFVDVHDDPPSIVMRSGGCRLTMIPVDSRGDGRLSRADLATIGRVIVALRAVGRALRASPAAREARRGRLR